MPMRGLIKRDDPKLQASVHTPGAAGQLPDGACLRSFAVAGGAAAAHAHVRNEPIPRRLSFTVLWSLIRRRGVHSLEACCTRPLICRSHAHPRPPLLASSSCFPRPQLGLLVLG